MKLSRCQEEVLLRGLDHWIHAAEVAFVAGKVGGAGTADRRRELSIAAITDLLSRGLIQIGMVTDSGFQTWGLADVDAIQRAENDWRDLARDPGLGELFWLNLTPEGQRLANEIWANQKSH